MSDGRLRLMPIVLGSALLAAPASVYAAPDTSAVVDAADGTKVHVYGYEPARRSKRPPILMFHQGNSDARGELDGIAERLAASGHRVFTADLRSGGAQFGANATAAQFSTRQFFCTAYPDTQAALAFVRARTGAKPVLIGSSYSAALVVQLAAEQGGDVAGFVSFSPAIGLPGCTAEDYLAALKVPGLAFRSLESKDDPKAHAANALWRRHGYEVVELPVEGHGASLLVAERTKGDVKPAWDRLQAFLATVGRGSAARKKVAKGR